MKYFKCIDIILVIMILVIRMNVLFILNTLTGITPYHQQEVFLPNQQLDPQVSIGNKCKQIY